MDDILGNVHLIKFLKTLKNRSVNINYFISLFCTLFVLFQLLAMKKDERERQLAEAERSHAKTRPKSARAARSSFGARKAINSLKHIISSKLTSTLLHDVNTCKTFSGFSTEKYFNVRIILS